MSIKTLQSRITILIVTHFCEAFSVGKYNRFKDTNLSHIISCWSLNRCWMFDHSPSIFLAYIYYLKKDCNKTAHFYVSDWILYNNFVADIGHHSQSEKRKAFIFNLFAALICDFLSHSLRVYCEHTFISNKYTYIYAKVQAVVFSFAAALAAAFLAALVLMIIIVVTHSDAVQVVVKLRPAIMSHSVSALFVIMPATKRQERRF